MDESSKYLIHADVTANGVVEREDVVGAVYGQTEGLLGDELDLRTLQEASKVGRIDVDVDSEGGRSFGELTINSSMDRVETAVLAASLETIGRVGPCRAEFRVTAIEDVRATKRRSVVDRAKELLAESFDEPAASSQEILEEVRRAVRVEDITEYEGLPAGPNVADSDAIIVVEGRADVLTLLQFGIKNAVAVEGTDVPDAVAALTGDRTVTAFLDGDRGGDLILEELSQVGEVDNVALAPPDRSVEDLDRHEVRAALREKIPYDHLHETGADRAAVPTDGGTVTTSPGDDSTMRTPTTDAGRAADGASTAPAEPHTGVDTDDDAEPPVDGVADSPMESGKEADEAETDIDEATRDEGGDVADTVDIADTADGTDAPTGEDERAVQPADEVSDRRPETLPEQVTAVVEAETETVRLLDESFATLSEAAADEAFDAIEAAEETPSAIVLDGTLTQRILDVAAQRGVGQIVARETGAFVKQPVGVRVRTADEL